MGNLCICMAVSTVPTTIKRIMHGPFLWISMLSFVPIIIMDTWVCVGSSKEGLGLQEAVSGRSEREETVAGW
jgi:hypothetical protein